ncbi:hypothetical protein [Nocardia asiatica]|uniref:hypothetical protein n=1 Tax=Nocardia asiatica TaxID=209252 RepID=UPI003EDF9789
MSKNPEPKDSSHVIREQCDRTLSFFADNLGVSDVAIEYGSENPEGQMSRGAMCFIKQESRMGAVVGQTRLRAMLPSETEPPLVKGDSSYIPQTGYKEKVWLNRTDDAVGIATTVDGWQGTLTINTALIRIESGEPRLKISDQQIRGASEFLIDLTADLGS